MSILCVFADIPNLSTLGSTTMGHISIKMAHLQGISIPLRELHMMRT